MKTNDATKKQITGSIVTVLGLLPCLVGISVGYYLKLNGTVWLSDTWGVWPVVCVVISAGLLQSIIESIQRKLNARRVTFFGWLRLGSYSLGVFAFVVWSSLYFSLWLGAIKIHYTTAIVSDGVVHKISDSFRGGIENVSLMTGRSHKKFVHNIEGHVLAQSMEVQYSFDKSFVSTRMNDEDLSTIVVESLNTILAPWTTKSRTERVHLLTTRGELEQINETVCRVIMRGNAGCPLSLKLTPANGSTMRSMVWSTEYSEAEAIAEKHLPTLIQLLTNDALGLVERDTAFELFMELATQVEQFGVVARTSRTLNGHQFDNLLEKILAAEDGGDEAGNTLISVNYLSQEQWQKLRDKALRDARVEFIVKHATKMHLTDAEIARLSPRIQSMVAKTPDVAVSILDIFGERLPTEVQSSAVDAIVHAEVGYAIETLRTLNFSTGLRERLMKKVLLAAALDENDLLNVSKEKLEASLTPKEMEALTAALIKNNSIPGKWLDFVVRALPVRAMTQPQQKTVVDELMFVSAKTALEFVSVNHKHLDRAIVNDVTRDYVKTIDREFCLHLTHRNNNRRMEFFSQDQIQIFRDCAQVR
jgi:hypothetical protein